MEEPLRAAVKQSQSTLVQDDREPNKAWTVSPFQMFMALLAGILADPNWLVRNDPRNGARARQPDLLK